MFAAMLAVVRKIPRGKVMTYGAIARAAGFPGASRQVVWALRSVGDPSLPWHRVLAAKGVIKLPGESGFEQKMRLRREGVEFRGERVDMEQHELVHRTQKAAKKAPPRKQ